MIFDEPSLGRLVETEDILFVVAVNETGYFLFFNILLAWVQITFKNIGRFHSYWTGLDPNQLGYDA